MTDSIIATTPAAADPLPLGVRLVPLTPHVDDRGVFTELWRDEWGTGVTPVQWNAVRSAAGVLRGVHVHPRHDDYLCVAAGSALIGLHDMRPESDSFGRSSVVELGALVQGMVIPSGVAHGFWFREPTTHLYAVSETFDPADELGCRWDDPRLGIDWPTGAPILSARDETLPSLPELRVELNGWRAL